MRNMSLCISLFFLSTLVGCSGVPQDEIDAKLASTAPEKKNKSRLLVYRDEDTFYMGVSARLDVNGKRVAELWRGDAFATNVPPGKITLSVDDWSMPGHYTATLDALPNTTYTFEVTPRDEAVTMLSGAIGGTVDYAVNDNSGAFSITLKNATKSQ